MIGLDAHTAFTPDRCGPTVGPRVHLSSQCLIKAFSPIFSFILIRYTLGQPGPAPLPLPGLQGVVVKPPGPAPGRPSPTMRITGKIITGRVFPNRFLKTASGNLRHPGIIPVSCQQLGAEAKKTR